MAKANEVIVLISGSIGFVSSSFMLLRLYRGGVVKSLIPCVSLFFVSVVSTINMIVELVR